MPDIVGSLNPPRLTAAPSSPAVGQLYYNTSTNILYWWNGTAWIAASLPANVPSGALAKTTALSIPTGGANTAITWDNQYVAAAGGMTQGATGFTVPVAGVYNAQATVYWALAAGSAAANRYDTFIAKNAVDQYHYYWTAYAAGAIAFIARLGGIIRCAVNDVLQVYCANSGAAAVNVAVSNPAYTNFSCHFVST